MKQSQPFTPTKQFMSYQMAALATVTFLCDAELFGIKIFENIRGYNIMEEEYIKKIFDISNEITSKLLEQGFTIIKDP